MISSILNFRALFNKNEKNNGNKTKTESNDNCINLKKDNKDYYDNTLELDKENIYSKKIFKEKIFNKKIDKDNYNHGYMDRCFKEINNSILEINETLNENKYVVYCSESETISSSEIEIDEDLIDNIVEDKEIKRFYQKI